VRGTEPEQTEQLQRPAQVLAAAVLAVGILLACVCVVVVVDRLSQPGGEVRVLVDRSAFDLTAVAGLPEDSRLEPAASTAAGISSGPGSVPVSLLVPELPVGLRLLTGLPTLTAGALGLAAAVLLRLLLLDVAMGRPFAVRNPARFRGLAVLTIAYAVAPGLFASLATVAVLHRIDPASHTPLGVTILDLPLLPFLLAGALMVMAEVFRHGRALTDDVDGLV
jgi:hypothetical protein